MLCSVRTEVKNIRREANSVAHRLARNALLLLEDKVWVGEPRSFVKSNVLTEQGSSIIWF